MYVGLSVSSGGFVIHGYPISFDVSMHMFIGVDGLLFSMGWKFIFVIIILMIIFICITDIGVFPVSHGLELYTYL